MFLPLMLPLGQSTSDGVVEPRRQGNQAAPLLGKGLFDHPVGGGVDAGIGDLGAPLGELGVEILQVAE